MKFVIINLFLIISLNSCKKDQAAMTRYDKSAVKLSADNDLDLRPDFLESSSRQKVSDFPKWNYKSSNLVLVNSTKSRSAKLRLLDSKIAIKHELLRWARDNSITDMVSSGREKKEFSTSDKVKEIFLHQLDFYILPTQEALDLIQNAEVNDEFVVEGVIDVIPYQVPSHISIDGNHPIKINISMNYKEIEDTIVQIKALPLEWPNSLVLNAIDRAESMNFKDQYKNIVSKLIPVLYFLDNDWKWDFLSPNVEKSELSYLGDVTELSDNKNQNNNNRLYIASDRVDFFPNFVTSRNEVNPGNQMSLSFSYPPLKTTIYIQGTEHGIKRYPPEGQTISGWACPGKQFYDAVFWTVSSQNYTNFTSNHSFPTWWILNGVEFRNLSRAALLTYFEKPSESNSQFKSITIFSGTDDLKSIIYRPTYQYHDNSYWISRCGHDFSGVYIPLVASEISDEVVTIDSF